MIHNPRGLQGAYRSDYVAGTRVRDRYAQEAEMKHTKFHRVLARRGGRYLPTDVMDAVFCKQGYGVESSILNQDNLSAILKMTKHINVRYFYIKDLIGSGEITMKHCPATEMLADHFTKPLQGTMFQKFRAEIQGVPIDMCDADMGWDRPCAINERELSKACPSPQECVGTHEDRTYAYGKITDAKPTVGKKDTGTVSKYTVGGGIGAMRPHVHLSLP
jgi:hypothetical protein